MDSHRHSQYPSLTNPHLSAITKMPVLDNSEVSHLTGDPLFRRPLSNLSSKEKAIRHNTTTSEHCRRLGKNTVSFFLNLFQRLAND